MRYFKRYLLVLILLASAAAPGQEPDYNVEIFGAFTTSSKLFPHANDPDELNRSFFLALNNIFHAGIELRRSITSSGIQVGLAAESIQKTDVINVPRQSGIIRSRDGYRVIPIELTGYFQLPIGNETIHVYIGGGGGLYFGARFYEYASVEAPAIDRTPGFGIHVLSGLEYSLNRRFSLRSEIKFRDVQFESVNQFSEAETIYNGRTVALDQTPFSSRLNVDGMTLRLGLAYHF